MNGYQQAILLLNGAVCGNRFRVQNIDEWYIDCVAELFPTQKYFLTQTGKSDTWVIKSASGISYSNISLSQIEDVNGFIRCFLELQSSVDLWKHKTKKLEIVRTPRLRIYGTEECLNFIMDNLPIAKKKIQYVTTRTGKTCSIAYQSPKDAFAILNLVNGYPRNEKIWEKWEALLNE